MQTHFWWVKFFGSRKEPNVKRRPGFTKMRNLVMRNQSQTNLASLLSTSLCPQKAESMTWRTMQGFCPLSCRRTSTPPQHWLQPATGLLHSNPHSSRCPDSSHTQLTNCSYCLKLLFCKQDSAAWRREFQIFFMNILFFTVKMYSQMPHTYNARMDLNLPYADNELEHWAGQNKIVTKE